MYSTITSISESPLVEGLIYAGTDDGLVQATEDGGKTWRKIDALPGVPAQFFVNEVKASRLEKDAVFAAVDSHKTGDYKPYLLRSDDRGRTWRSIAGDLPQRGMVWSVAQDHVKKDLLFAGTEYGIYVTLDGGARWVKLGGGLPTISFRDIEIQERESDLVGASFGRSFYVLDDYSPLRLIGEQALQKDALLFPVKKALLYIPQRPNDSSGKGTFGETYFTAPNPPFGAIFTYYLKDSLKTAAEARRDREKDLEKAGKPVTFPGWDELRLEDGEEKPAVILTVTDVAGQVVRRITGPVAQGIQRVAWDLRYPPVDPPQLEAPPPDDWGNSPQGPLVVPGTFTVSLAKRVAGVVTPIGEPQTFTVESLHLASLEEKDRQALLAFQQRAGELQRAMMGAAGAVNEALNDIQLMKKALADTPKADPKLGDGVRALEKKMRATLTTLTGDRVVQRRSESTLPSLMDRVSAQLGSTSPITATVRRDYDIAAAGFEKLVEEMRVLVEVDLPKLGAALEAAGAPWTPGRGVPRWKK
jgi:hypothetical protein